MRLAILSRNRSLHSIRRLLQEARREKVQCDIINPLECQLVVDGKNSRVLVGPNPIPHYDAILPRIGASITDYGLAVVKHFESLGSVAINSSRAIAESRDKMRSLQVLNEAGLQVPATVLSRSERGLKTAVQAVKGMPVVMKILQGTQGVGVMIVHTPVSLASVMDTLQGLDQDVILQQFIAEGAGRDYRAFVIGDKVFAAMLRTAPKGEFRTNIHRGGEGTLVKLSKPFEKAAILAAQKLGLSVAGVDLMESNEGPMIIEVNSSPGFEGIERATGLNIASAIMKHMIKTGRKNIRDQRKRRPKRRGK
jgi:ribosomal protein S6--L-glutamate ligase